MIEEERHPASILEPRRARFRGIFTPLITPLEEDASPDLASVRRLVDFQIDHGVHGLWVMGTSSEFAAFSAAERAAVVEAAIAAAQGRVPVIVNISDAGTRLAIAHGRHALAAGADAVAATPPYYYPHSQDEVLAHYRAMRDALPLPLFIYNIPQTVRVKVELPTARTLASEGTAAGIKDSQNDLEWFRQLAMHAHVNHLDFALFAGTRHLIDAAILAGGDGAIPSIANAFPALCVEVYQHAAAGEFDLAARAESDIIAIEALNARSGGSRNAATLGLLKTILQQRGIIARPDLTAPLRSLSAEERAAVLDCVEGMRRDQ
jgi:4-hydroxy-tetrahydrodipicolinate synthase